MSFPKSKRKVIVKVGDRVSIPAYRFDGGVVAEVVLRERGDQLLDVTRLGKHYMAWSSAVYKAKPKNAARSPKKALPKRKANGQFAKKR